MNPKAVLEFAAANNVKMLDLRFTDLPGLWHHVSFPIHELEEASFEEGFGMDGSSIRGWAAIHESDMLLVPDPSWYTLDPFTDTPTLVMIGDIIDPVTKQHYVEIRATLRRRPRPISPTRASPIRPTLGQKRNSLSLTTSASIKPSNMVITSSTPRKAVGTPAARRTTLVTGRVTRKVTSRFRPPIIIRTCAPRWS